jgi:hypothetical protein
MNQKPFVVNVGHTPTGRARNRRFATLAEALAFVSEVSRRSGIVLSIVRVS